MTITINNNEYKVKITLRAMLIFEQITKRPFNPSSMLDEYVYFYCILLANNPDMNMDFNKFMDALDDNPSIINQYKNILEEYNNQQKLFNDGGNADSKKNS